MAASDYESTYTGAQIDGAVLKVINPDTTPTQNSANLITSGAVYAALGDINTALAAIIGE